MARVTYLSELYETSANRVDELYRVNASPRFEPWHVDVLIEQISSLLSRCVQDRNEYFVTFHTWKALEDEISREELELMFSIAGVTAATAADKVAAAAEAAARKESIPDGSPGGYGKGLKGWHSRLIMNRENAFTKEPSSHSLEAAWTEAKISGQLNYIAGQTADAKVTALQSLINAQEIRNSAERARISKKQELIDRDRFESLHFDMRCKTLAARIRTDFDEAIHRAIPASTGLTTYFNYKEKSLEDRLTKVSVVEIDNGWNAIDELLSWTREVEAFLAGFSVATQHFTVVYALSSNSGWLDSLTKAKVSGTMKLSFNIPDAKLNHHCLIRLEGTGAHVNVKSESDRVWSAILKVPQEALIFDQNKRKKSVGQQKVPPAFLGRIATRFAEPQSEVVGGLSMMNASPIPSDGSFGWSIEIYPPTDAKDFDDLVNLDLEFHFAGLPIA